ncbi:hypothetical protein ITI46_00390 [Streptomyces oryzae]|uniref:Uncharacterized protein n=1 Tax=Streptomyces oryzae TaxID=1434886 RepID=A0ABS3X471_9ACTN|nr:hypothetical protein [Streptomyces oryzae]MBO8190183.1 hypothetical protein [Streptomyces oryzae]
MGAAVWSASVVLLLTSAFLALAEIQAQEDPADPTASVLERCGSLVSGDKARPGQSAEWHSHVCGPARDARLDWTVLFLAAGTATAALATVMHIRRGRRRPKAPAAEPQNHHRA